MKINKLIRTDLDVEIENIKTNSKDVKKGDVFVCALGNIDKNNYINDAIKNGCKLIVTDKDIESCVPYIKVNNPNETLVRMLDRFYSYPLISRNLIGVTGTDGKTTIASIVRDMTDGASIGTNGLQFKDYCEELHNTTPSLDKIYECFNKIKEHNIKDIIMEVSSESYLTKRIPNLTFDIGIFTNFSEDHISPKDNFEDYFNCKMNLIKNSHLVIINHDSKYFKKIIKYNDNYLTYGKKKSTLTLKKYKKVKDLGLIFNFFVKFCGF